MNVRVDGKKKICILRSNPVRPDSRVEKEAWSLTKSGYEVHILAWDRDTNQKEIHDYIQVTDVRIPITRLGYKASYGEGMKNLKAYLSFQFSMRRWLRSHDFDVVHACDFDTAFFSSSVVHRKKEKFIFDIFDFLYDKPKGILQRVVKKAQLHIINHANATIICTEERKKQILGSNPKNLTVIHNTPDEQQISISKINLYNSGKIRIVYVGILQDYRLLKEVVEVVSESTLFELHIGGFGKYDFYIQNAAKEYENIHFYGRMSYSETLALEKECDIMLALYDPTIGNHFYAAPNKFYESLMLGKPVMMVKNTGMSTVVKDNNIGVLIDYSKDGFIKGLENLIEQKESWSFMSQRMKVLYKEQYSWSEMEKRLLKLYSQLLDVT